MKISTKGRYALRMLLDLAQNQGDGYVSLKDIAQRQDVSKKYLEQIVPLLNKSNMLRTNRGYQGGYRLSRLRRSILSARCSASQRATLHQWHVCKPVWWTVPVRNSA